MIKGRKVYDPITNEWSTGYWLPLYDYSGRISKYVPIWRDIIKNEKYNNNRAVKGTNI